MFGWFRKKPKPIAQEPPDHELYEWARETAIQQLIAEGWIGVEVSKLVHQRIQELMEKRRHE